MLHSPGWKLERLNHVFDLSISGAYVDEATWDLDKVAATTREDGQEIRNNLGP